MLRVRLLMLSVLAAALGMSGFVGCGDTTQSDPRQTVIAMFGAMEKNDQARLAHLLDLKELMTNTENDYALNSDEPRVFTNPQQILEDLTNDGLTKTRWFSYQRIVNKAEVMGDVATVGVTFVDKEKSKGFITKFGLHKVNGKWKIYSFKTESAPPESTE
ncbi:MAG: hypothetical protein D6800_10845 [Candidatus Zixiibacteriota bacterium]|nr:MAG: hypothetical protein D6800_10845 [candidate division Zixibacteria bacterium]